MPLDPETSPDPKRRPNPVLFAGSLIYWLEVPSNRQHYIHGILEGYDDLGYYQTMIHGYREDADGQVYALGRLTSSEDSREETEALLAAFADEYGLRVAENVPDIPPDEQPSSRKLGGAAPGNS
jgi:hypothetical protein